MNWPIGIATLLTCIGLVPLSYHAEAGQPRGSIAGRLMDTTGGALPGVSIGVEEIDPVEASAFTTRDGYFEVTDLSPGVYTVTFSLPGFETEVREGVDVGFGTTTIADVVLQIGCIQEVDYVTFPPAQTVERVDAIVRLRILSVAESVDRRRRRCGGLEYAATVLQVVKSPAGRLNATSTTIRIYTADDDGRYAPGDEYIAFLGWRPERDEYYRWGHPREMIHVTNGRVGAIPWRAEVSEGLAEGQTVETFLETLRLMLPVAP